LVIEDTALKLS